MFGNIAHAGFAESLQAGLWLHHHWSSGSWVLQCDYGQNGAQVSGGRDLQSSATYTTALVASVLHAWEIDTRGARKRLLDE